MIEMGYTLCTSLEARQHLGCHRNIGGAALKQGAPFRKPDLVGIAAKHIAIESVKEAIDRATRFRYILRGTEEVGVEVQFAPNRLAIMDPGRKSRVLRIAAEEVLVG